jgi:acetyltransferase-like isoleucine patch superfamily enzyme
LIRKIKLLWNQLLFKSRLSSYYYLSKKRIHVHKSFKAGFQFSIQSDLSETFISIDENVSARDNFKILIGQNGRLSIGKNNFFNNGCSINCLGKIDIGDDNQFGENVLIYDHNHRYSDKTKLVSEQGYNIGHIKIGNNCWIGSNVVILKDVEIGDNVVIGAGCVIHKSIGSESIVINQQNLVQKQKIENIKSITPE